MAKRLKKEHPELVREAYELYVVQGLTSIAVSKAMSGVPSSRTIRAWAKKEGWDDERKSYQASPLCSIKELHKAKLDMIRQMREAAAGEKSKFADGIFKIDKMIKNEQKLLAPRVMTLLVMEQFANYVKSNYPLLAGKLRKVISGFFDYMRGVKNLEFK